MRRRVQLHSLTSMLISLCVSMGAQQPQTPVQGVVAHIDDSTQLKNETRAISPKDRGLVTNENYLAQLLEYAPQGLVCGYIMRNQIGNIVPSILKAISVVTILFLIALFCKPSR